MDGSGARKYGGRWNSVGTAVVYASSSLSLATLELIVNVEDVSTIYKRYVVIPIEFDLALIEEIEIDALSPGWNSSSINPVTQKIGDQWVAGMSSPLLKVPSCVTEIESNYLLNPLHPDFSKINIRDAFKFEPDVRLVASP